MPGGLDYDTSLETESFTLKGATFATLSFKISYDDAVAPAHTTTHNKPATTATAIRMCSIGDIDVDRVTADVDMAAICGHPVPENTPESAISKKFVSRAFPRHSPGPSSPQLKASDRRLCSRMWVGMFSGTRKHTVDLDHHQQPERSNPCPPP